MTAANLHETLAILSTRRPVFHSEADFQHELAFEIHRAGFQVRLEVPRDVTINGTEVRAEIDLLITGESPTVIELKYVKQATSITHNGEVFALAGTWGTNLSRFDCLADLRRVEGLVQAHHAQQGFTIFLTNAPSAWQDDVSNTENMARAFSIHQGRTLLANEPLDWHPPTVSEKSVSKKRLTPYAPITLGQSQVCNWNNYSHLNQAEGVFKYLLMSA